MAVFANAEVKTGIPSGISRGHRVAILHRLAGYPGRIRRIADAELRLELVFATDRPSQI